MDQDHGEFHLQRVALQRGQLLQHQAHDGMPFRLLQVVGIRVVDVLHFL
ncbi:MAG: hypothetical protein IRY99_18205 [Isosphaeraceae bacterium]|nr:hypothetical protein [Isosphaeraceae bacterium]